MTNSIVPTERAGHTNIPQGQERTYTCIVLVEERPGTVDRVVGVLRRRRANMQTLVLGRGEQPNLVRITVLVKDSEVGIDHLIEQLKKIVDVREVLNLADHQAIARELALIKVSSTIESFHEIVEVGHQFGAHIVDATQDTVTLEVTGSEKKLEKCIEQLRRYNIREIARSGRVTMVRGSGA